MGQGGQAAFVRTLEGRRRYPDSEIGRWSTACPSVRCRRARAPTALGPALPARRLPGPAGAPSCDSLRLPRGVVEIPDRVLRTPSRSGIREAPCRIALIAPPWYTIPPSGYGGIEWVVALLADGLTDRGHDVTLFAAPGSGTKARLVSPLDETPPPSHRRPLVRGQPRRLGLRARRRVRHPPRPHRPGGGRRRRPQQLPDHPHLHGPFTEQAHMLYSRVARQHWFVAISESQRSMAPRTCAGPGSSTTASPWSAIPSVRTRATTCSSWAGPTRRRRRTWPSRPPGGPGAGW